MIFLQKNNFDFNRCFLFNSKTKWAQLRLLAPQYIWVSDFVSKIDGVRYSLGCTTPNCPRRHVPLSVNLPQRTRQSYFNLCRVWKVREWRLWSRWFKVAIIAPCSFPPPPYALLRKFFPLFLSACCNELEWMSSEANVLRLCAALDKLRLGSLRGPPSRRSSYWLGRDINPFSSFIHCLKHS